jgi:hypothetical protein
MSDKTKIESLILEVRNLKGQQKDLRSQNDRLRIKMHEYKRLSESRQVRTDTDKSNEILADKYCAVVGLLSDVMRDIKIAAE